MLYYKHDSRKMCIDATAEDESVGRLINHSIKNANLKMRVVVADKGMPQVVFIASKEIHPEDELAYDYGERRKRIIDVNPRLKE